MLNCVNEGPAEKAHASANDYVKFHQVKAFGSLQLEAHNNTKHFHRAYRRVTDQHYDNTTQLFTVVC